MGKTVPTEAFAPQVKDRAVEIYRALGNRCKNHVARTQEQLLAEGMPKVARSSLLRWVSHSRQIPLGIQRDATAVLPTYKAVKAAKARGELDDIPEAILAAIGPRMLIVARGKGLEKVEDAIGRMADVIAGRADQVAAQLLDTEEESQTTKTNGEVTEAKVTRKAQAAKNVVGALATLANALHIVTAARVARSVAFRNFAEGDQLSGMAEKFKAEAETTRAAAAAENAKQIDGTAQHYGSADPLEEDEALAAVRDLEGQK